MYSILTNPLNIKECSSITKNQLIREIIPTRQRKRQLVPISNHLTNHSLPSLLVARASSKDNGKPVEFSFKYSETVLRVKGAIS